VSDTAATPATTTEDEHLLAARRLRDFSFAQVILLVLQTVLGMRVNLFVQVPGDDQGKGLLSSFGNAMSKGPAEIAAHAGFGLLVFINACLIVVFSLTVRGVSVKLVSVLGWLAIAGAAVSGASFVNATPDTSSTNNASFAMALLTMLAVACYAWNLFAIAKANTEPTPEPKAKVEAQATPEAEAEAEPGAEPETEATPEPETGAKAETEPTPETETEAEAEPETETHTAPEAEATPETEAEAEPETESETEPA
jgi:hypothetical protein